ncbi:MAG: 1-deoxy-D-xylulose-5-phosphate reductoisomerase [Aeromicrobium sp.]|jgi:1-deoxy-D-xylulose-5-phosphate reductoisomerase|uniref:1-deoxy-D-xylulose-5-phosphate reductoisomerase n=1 Tax=Aeromicrobium sp. TaxID=1871063 RepID=UPI00260D04A0|nr:1-deoxy-D-xylulose-5-phosphate reductoisomerase [Aeromicrobium sp.]MCW2789858.1 1-deoxy-D-xylulose-5-phosphate reductoisomerase [Aeromicrobium sp.]MCW2824570.1 1-deoxy-D-xylulose-5-phosphate reductoisomerase [Aeromicrobium sp.]
MRKRVAILGSTGSIGTQALEVIAANPDRFEVVALAAGGANPRLLAEQAIAFDVPLVAVARGSAAEDVQLALYAEAQRRGYAHGDHRVPRLIVGPDAAVQVARTPCDVVLNGMTGAVGLLPTLAALEAGTTLALANKESLIIGGELVIGAAKPGQLVPVDSEHSALAQAMRGERREDVRKLVVTASGGPFRGRTRAELADVTPEQAMAHPTWDMGPVITINSATLVNKGLEVIEANLLFDIDFDRIEVVVHPPSIVHSMVEFTDGATMVQASPPDMKLPIALGLAWPERVPDAAAGCDWTRPATWEFFPLDDEAFPAVSLARRAGTFGRTGPAVFNAANEICVDAFVDGRLDFLGIVDTVGSVLDEHLSDPDVARQEMTLDGVLGADRWARTRAAELVERR